MLQQYRRYVPSSVVRMSERDYVLCCESGGGRATAPERFQSSISMRISQEFEVALEAG